MILSVAVLLVLRAAHPGIPDSLMGPGVSSSLAEYRRARIRDVRYDLSLDVTGRDTASGHLAVRFTLRRPGDVILDFRGHVLEAGSANGLPLANTEWNRAHVRIPAASLRAGANRIEFAFKTPIAAAGASIIRVRDPSDGETYLYTLLVPSDANLLFPCFDQPDIKARLNLTLVTPSSWKAVSNGAQLRVDSSSSDKRTHVFRESEPISTYLMAFAAGPWSEVRATGTRKPITLYVRKSREREVDADSIISANDRAAAWLEEYFGTPFPFQKLDVVLAPAFPFGGMEHPGAIFYSEERFVFRERPTRTQLLGRTATVYHEVAHQWFGDLVTMKWFDDLWLKEGFATYMAAKMQAALDPASEAWKTFYLRNKPSAYAVDLTEGTTPVWQRLANLDQAKSNYGAIVYNKAPSVLKQLNYVVGDAAFRSGLRAFLKQHAYANATWRDLLDAVGASGGRPLRTWGDQYILRPGMPIIEQSIALRGGRIERLALVQRPARPLSGRKPWPIKLEVLIARDSTTQRIPLSLVSETTYVSAARGTPAPSFVFANAGDNAHALVLLDTGSVSALEGSIGGVRDGLLRAQLWGALWDLVREARLAPDRFVRLALRELPREPDEQIVIGIVGRLSRATVAYLSPARKETLVSDVEHLLLGQMNDTTRSYDIRKAQLDAYIRVAATPSSIGILDGMLDSTTLAGAPLRAPTRWAIVTRLQALGAPSANQRLAAESARDSTAEGARRTFVAGAARPDSATKADYFRRYFADSSLNEDWATASLDAFNDLDAQRLTRRYLRPALDSLQWIQRNRRIFFLGSWLGGFLDGQTDSEALAIVRVFLSERADLAPDLRAKVQQSVDELERTVRLRRVFGEGGISMTVPRGRTMATFAPPS
jgi:aminopeptidase N